MRGKIRKYLELAALHYTCQGVITCSRSRTLNPSLAWWRFDGIFILTFSAVGLSNRMLRQKGSDCFLDTKEAV